MPATYLAAPNWITITRQLPMLMVVAAGVPLVMVIGDSDLSVGSIASFAGIVAPILFSLSYPIWFAIGIALLIGLLGGLKNGALVSFIGILPFAATLATLAIFLRAEWVMAMRQKRGRSPTLGSREDIMRRSSSSAERGTHRGGDAGDANRTSKANRQRTTGAAFAAGKPQIVVPFGVDQPFWASRVRETGVGTSIRRKTLTVEKLEGALRQVLKDASFRIAAKDLSAPITNEEGGDESS